MAHALGDEPFEQEAILSKVMLQAKAAILAERITFFNLDEAKNELVASLFDDGQVGMVTMISTSAGLAQ